MSKTVKTYRGKAKDVETIIRLRSWITYEIKRELRKKGINVKDCKFQWSYVPEEELFEYNVYAIV